LGVAAYENQIYAIGGETDEGVVDVVERYDPGRNQWEKLSPLPVALADVSAAVVGGDIYVPGGRTGSGQLSNQLEVYDPLEDRWEGRKAMPVALSAYALVAFEGKLYVFGGWDGSKFVNSVYEYDPSTDSWSEKTSMPTKRGYAGAAAAGGKIHVIGGFDGKKALAVNETYLPERDLAGEVPWSKAKPLPQARYAMGIASLADIVHVVGGKGDEGTTLTPLDYFPQSDEWQMIQSPFQGTWSSLGLVPLETRLHAVGGELDGKPTGMTLSYQAIYTISIPLVH
jgi:N-acetylneuraminic acid mutarotase